MGPIFSVHFKNGTDIIPVLGHQAKIIEIVNNGRPGKMGAIFLTKKN
ncbi:MAG: hypothetical protein GY754_31070 [bacterium]|nr:hypothetical protein [bacterium]